MKFIKSLSLAVMLVISNNAFATENDYSISGLWDKLKYNTSETWNNPDGYNAFVPVTMWHNRLFYDKEHLEKYNEEPWGFGVGMTRYDNEGDMHTLFAMGFKDSNFKLQTIAGYSYQKLWYFGCSKEWYTGAGFILSLTQRHEYSYIPVPLPLPAVSIGHKKIALQMAYVPGIKNDGNVAFVWTKFEF